MSDEESQTNSYRRLRRPYRSCDLCRQRKIRCDGPNVSDGCSNCLAFGSPCTYVQPPRKRGPNNNAGRVIEELRRKNESLEAKLRSLSICSLCAQPLKSQPNITSPSTGGSAFAPESSDAAIPSDAEHPPAEDDFSHVELADRFRMLSLNSMEDKFFGAASSFTLVSNVIAVKEMYLGRPAAKHPRSPLFWDILPWEKEEYDQRPQYVYPTSDLITSLLDLYFTHVHPTFPLLHRPSFERSVAEELHLKDVQFGAGLLVVLGIASRYSDDPRVFVEGDAALSAGWKFVKQVQIVRKGLGIRALQHRGGHRRNTKNTVFGPEEERWKRAFWYGNHLLIRLYTTAATRSLFLEDRLLSFFQGRPAGFHVEDYDVELPLEVDDEYWEEGFMQPPGQPSLLSYFVCKLRLCEILGDALRRLYASNKSKVLMGWTGPEWEQGAVAELDSAMNDWLNTVPPHLRWDPNGTPGAFFDQSAVLYATYYYIQIAIHRPYIHKATMMACPSLSICTSAARSCIHLADVWLKKKQGIPLQPFLTNPVFDSGVILVLNAFGSKRRVGHSIDKSKDLSQVRTAMAFLKSMESRYRSAGRIGELLRELQSLDDPLLRTGPPEIEPHSADSGASNVALPSTMTLRDTSSSSTETVGREFHSNQSQSYEPLAEHLWKNTPLSSDQPLPLDNNPRPEISIEQLLADTAEFDTANLAPDSVWSNTSELANSLLADEFRWMTTPTDFTTNVRDAAGVTGREFWASLNGGTTVSPKAKDDDHEIEICNQAQQKQKWLRIKRSNYFVRMGHSTRVIQALRIGTEYASLMRRTVAD
ncbi:hypothetical protein DFH09DRAFT_1280056 [Mycena vulgaris]|nr:hypothetical protein DFH09DRAFT_1280056 [Mycena vulgaris]